MVRLLPLFQIKSSFLGALSKRTVHLTISLALLMTTISSKLHSEGKNTLVFSPLLTVDFEINGNGTVYRANTFNDGVGDVWTRWNVSSNPAGPNPTGTTSGANFFQAYSGQQGNYAFGGEDMDASENPLGTGKPGYITLRTVDVSTYQSGEAKIELLLGASTEGNSRYEAADYIKIEYAFDVDISTGATSVGSVPDQVDLETGTYTIGGAFYGGVGASSSDYFQDTDLDGAGNVGASSLTTTLTDFAFTFSIPATANAMSVRIVAIGNSAEEAVVDNIRLSAETGSAPTSPEINLKQASTDITSGGTHPFGAVQIGDSKELIFTVENTGDGALDITSITPTGIGYSISSAISIDPVPAAGSATFTVRFQPTATAQTSGSVTIASDDVDEGSYMINFTSSVSAATLSFKVLLEGPLSGTAMSTIINSDLPLDPSTAYPGVVAESSSGIPGTAVDWIEVELRAGTAASTKVGINRAALLHSDGIITDKEGDPLTMSQVDGSSYHVVIHHRNHLSVMSSAAVSATSGTYTFDFTAAQANNFNNGADGAMQVGSVFAMIAGDADDNNSISADDRAGWRVQNGAAFLYGSNGDNDLNLDGAINAVDRNDYIQPNSDKASQVPN